MRFSYWLKMPHKKQKGFTLIETLVAMAITGVVAAGVTTTMYQIRSVSNINFAHIMAVTQVENGVHYVNRDVQSAQILTPQGNYGFPLSLTWVDWNTNVTNTVTYELQAETAPLTTYSLMRTLNQNPSTPVARFIVSYPYCNTVVAVNSSPRNTVLKVADTSAFPPVGALQLPGEALPVTYSGKTSNSFTGIPTSGSGSLTLAHTTGQSVTTYSSYCSYNSANHTLVLQLTSVVVQGGEQQEETRQLVIVPRPGS